MGKIVVCLYNDGTVLVESRGGEVGIDNARQREGRITGTCPHLHEKGWEYVHRRRSLS